MTRAFTLVELLVVITIIVVLLALLAPAMDQAIYQAELAVCAARVDGIATGVTSYAAGNARTYPYRPTLAEGSRWRRAITIATQQNKDDRPYLRAALGGSLEGLLDPLAGKIDIDYPGAPVDTNSNYSLWFGMRYAGPRGGKGMLRLGDRFEWTDSSRGPRERESFSVLVSDHDTPYDPGAYNKVLASHPDPQGVMWLEIAQVIDRQAVDDDLVLSDGFVRSWWTSLITRERGPIDTNYAFTDGSVERYREVEWDDAEMARVPWDTQGSGWQDPANPTIWHHLPRR